MSHHYTFTFKVTQLHNKGQNSTLDKTLNNNRAMAFMALLRALAAQPSLYEGMKDEEIKIYLDKKCSDNFPEGVKYEIQYHDLKL